MLFDVIGAIVSLLSTFYFIRLDKKAWPVSLIATCVNGYLYWQKGIYADMALEAFYFLSTCYGWYLWSRPKKRKQSASISTLSFKQGLILFPLVGLSYLVIVKLLLSLTHSNVAVIDALTTSLSLAAQLLMCHKIISTWILWFFTDALYAYLYFCKLIPIHGFLMLLYCGMAVAGYLRWSQQQASQLKLLSVA